MGRELGVVAQGTPTRLDTDCTTCGWADVWQYTAHSLTPHGVGTIATVNRCARCNTIQAR